MTRRNTRSGLFFALLALMSQLAWNARVPDLPRMELAALLGDAGAICHIGGAAGGHESPSTPGRDCPICPCCTGTVLPAVLPVPIVWLPVLVTFPRARFAVTPPATGPPAQRFAIARPRGPPARA